MFHGNQEVLPKERRERFLVQAGLPKDFREGANWNVTMTFVTEADLENSSVLGYFFPGFVFSGSDVYEVKAFEDVPYVIVGVRGHTGYQLILLPATHSCKREFVLRTADDGPGLDYVKTV